MVGAVDVDVPDSPIEPNFDLDSKLAASGNGVTEGASLLVLRWLNVKDIPLVLWLGSFAVIWWFLSASLWTAIDARFLSVSPGWLWSSLLVVRNLGLAIPLTKLVTQPMKGWFKMERLDAQSLIGKECQISSSEATPEFGQVKFKTRGAPLLLNIRTDGPHLPKGTNVWITHYDTKRRVYIVSPTTTAVDTPDLEQMN
jgi:hypothetical protein